MIRFSAALVVVAVGVLIGGVATSMLPLVYVAIGLSAAALIALAIGVALKRDELFAVTGQPVGDVMGAAAERSALARRPGVYPPAGYPPAGYPSAVQSGSVQPGSVQPGAGQAYPGQAFPIQPGLGIGSAPGAPGPGGPGPAGPGPGGPGPGGPGPAGRPGPSTASPRDAGTETRTDLTETRADLKAVGADTPKPKTGSEPASGSADTRLDARSGSSLDARPGSSEETRLDLPPVRTDETRTDIPAHPPAPGPPAPGPPASGPPASRPDEKSASRTPSGLSSGADETRFGLSPVLANETRADLPVIRPEISTAAGSSPAGSSPAGSRAGASSAAGPSATGGSPAGADETRFDLPAQSAAPAKPGTSESPAPATGSKAAPKDTQVAVIPGVPRYHTLNCILIRFMDEADLEKKTLDQAKAAGCTPCTACQPDVISPESAD